MHGTLTRVVALAATEAEYFIGNFTPAMVRPGRSDLHENPTASLNTPFYPLRFYLPYAALDEVADEVGIPWMKRLQAPQFGRRDRSCTALRKRLRVPWPVRCRLGDVLRAHRARFIC
jgi:hypothetical protein